MIASASLKRRKDGRRGVAPAEIPRRDCLGLIEAFTRKLIFFAESRIPRRDCLGLIEALSSYLESTMTNLRFRGVIASASLKRYPFFITLTVDPRFRGVIASASLKREQRAQFTVEEWAGIPRRDCLGLIEARCRRR